jgi:hypothetical protein
MHEQFTDAEVISEQRATETYIKKNASWLLIAMVCSPQFAEKCI